MRLLGFDVYAISLNILRKIIYNNRLLKDVGKRSVNL